MEVREGLDQLDLIGRALEKDRVGNGNMVDMDMACFREASKHASERRPLSNRSQSLSIVRQEVMLDTGHYEPNTKYPDYSIIAQI